MSHSRRRRVFILGAGCSANYGCVLTFNYDRLFEIAFLDQFKKSQGCFGVTAFPLYGKSVLNSGIDHTRCWESKTIEVEPDRFCFLKLHGSAGWWAGRCASPPNAEWRNYRACSPEVPEDLIQLEGFLAQNNRTHVWQPLIAFPHEKQLSTSGDPVDFEQSPYIAKIWRHATSVLEEATEVTVIGYSFAEIDRKHVVERLLSKTPRATRIRIENKNPGDVERALKDFECLQGRLELIPKMF